MEMAPSGMLHGTCRRKKARARSHPHATMRSLSPTALRSVSEYREASRDIEFTSERELDRLFRLADHNGDDEITLEEYTNFDERGSVYDWHRAMCPQSSYKPGPLPSNGRCLACAANTTSRMGADDVEDCVCDFGYTLHDGACVACASGFFKPYPGLSPYPFCV